jgi:uncharacterized membrane protein YfcA
MDGFAFWSLAVLAAFCVGLSKGGAPAFGALVVPILWLTISPVAAAGLLLPVFVFSDVFGVWAYRKYANWAILRIAVIGTGIGWATAHIVSDNFVRVLIGVIGFTFSLFFLLRSRANTQATSAGRTAGLFWTTIAGFTGFVSHAGAPPWQVWVLPQKLPKMVFAGTSTFAFAMMNALKIVPYYALGQLQADNLRVTLILFIPAVIAVLVAYKLIRICPNGCFMPSSHGRCCLCRSN